MEGDKIPKIGSSSIGTEAFPTSLRVLVVDDDRAYLKIVERMLRTSKYQVVTAMKAIDALNLLRERKGKFDLVLTEVNMPEMDGFQLLDHIMKEFKIPVILMSIEDRLNDITKGLESGACFYLLKPVTLDDIDNLWQHIFLKRNNMQDSEQIKSYQEVLPYDKVMEEDIEHANSIDEDNCMQQESKKKKCRQLGNEEEEGKNGSSSQKKARMVWSVDLHNKFLEAINQLGLDKAVPKKIWELMNVPELTRVHIASHLQKYRLFVKKNTESQAMELGPPRCLINGPLNTNFPPSHPSLMFSSQQGCPQFSDQQCPQMSFHEGIGGNIQDLNVSNQMPSVCPAHFLNPEVSSSDSLAPLSYNQSFSMNNQGTRQQPWHGNSLSSNQQNVSNYLALGMDPNGNRMGAPLYANNHVGMSMVHQQSQEIPRHFVGESSNDISWNYNLMDETCEGNMDFAAIGHSHSILEINGTNPEYANQVMVSSNGFSNANQFQEVLTNVVVQQGQQPQIPSLPSDQQQQDEVDDIDRFFNMPSGIDTSTKEHNLD